MEETEHECFFSEHRCFTADDIRRILQEVEDDKVLFRKQVEELAQKRRRRELAARAGKSCEKKARKTKRSHTRK